MYSLQSNWNGRRYDTWLLLKLEFENHIFIIEAERAHPRDTSIAAKNTKRLFDVDKLTLEWSSDAIVDGAYKS